MNAVRKWLMQSICMHKFDKDEADYKAEYQYKNKELELISIKVAFTCKECGYKKYFKKTD